MDYLDKYNFLKSIYNQSDSVINITNTGISINNFLFESDDKDFYPDDNYLSEIINNSINRFSNITQNEFIKNNFLNFSCNKFFIYPVYKNDNLISDKVIILLHGLNESNWDKYHSWAFDLTIKNKATVILFPIAYHINRRPPDWAHSRKMNTLSRERKNFYSDISETSFVNAAISTRLQLFPDFFFWSGLRTYFDILKLVGFIKNGDFKLISPNARIDFLGYSIGAFLTEILFMSHPDLFSNSKAFLFCGGPVMSLMFAASKYIYDTETSISMTEFFVENFEDKIEGNPLLTNYFKNNEPSSLAFRSLLNFNRLKSEREDMLKNISKNIFALALSKDEVMPPKSVMDTLIFENSKTTFKELDFPFVYDHIAPFPLSENIRKETDKAYLEFIKSASEWFKTN